MTSMLRYARCTLLSGVLIASALIAAGCDTLEIRDDDGTIIRLTDACEGVKFGMTVEQDAPAPSSPKQWSPSPGDLDHEQGRLKADFPDMPKFDMNGQFRITVFVNSNVPNGCAVPAGARWRFTGRLNKNGELFSDTYWVPTSGFQRVP
jgi:hypothetical protein